MIIKLIHIVDVLRVTLVRDYHIMLSQLFCFLQEAAQINASLRYLVDAGFLSSTRLTTENTAKEMQPNISLKKVQNAG